MTAGDIIVLGPFDATGVGDQSGTGANAGTGGAIRVGLEGNGIVVADKIVTHTVGSQVVFTIIKAA